MTLISKVITTTIGLIISYGIISSLPTAHALDQIIRPYLSARSAGMGGVRYSTGLYDENFFSNPARVVENPEKRITVFDLLGEVNTDLVSNYRTYKKGTGDTVTKAARTAGTNNHARIQSGFPAVYFPYFLGSKYSVAAGLFVNGQVDLALRKSYSIDPDIILDAGPAITVGRLFLNDQSLALGATLHWTYRLSSRADFGLADIIKGASLKPSESGGEGAHTELDLGSQYRLPWQPLKYFELKSTLAVNNLFGGYYSNSSIDMVSKIRLAPRQQPRSFSIGVSAERQGWWRFGKTILAIESSDMGNNANGSFYRTLHIGAETEWKFLKPRLGFFQGYFSAGLGTKLSIFEIDFATYGEEAGLNAGVFQDRRYLMRLSAHL